MKKFLFLLLIIPSLAFAQDYDRVNAYVYKLKSSFMPDTLKALWWVESDWDMEDGPDIGICQVNKDTLKYYPWVDDNRLMTDWMYNMEVGNMILEDKLKWVKQRKRKKDWPAFCKRYNLIGLPECDIAILAYNGIQKDHSFLYAVRQNVKEKPWVKYLRKSITNK